MQRQKKYVVAFNRDRDFYQLPAALAEAGKLKSLVTDVYLPDIVVGTWLARQVGLAHRYCDAIQSRLVKCSPRVVLWQMLDLRLARSERRRSEIFNRIDTNLSRLAGREARRSGAGLFLYSGYALEAFKMLRDPGVPRLLFVYHPQGGYVRRILEDDFRRHPEVAASHHRHLEEIAKNEGTRVAEEIGMASGIACASTFTARSVQAAEGDRAISPSIIPYGCTVPTGADRPHETRVAGRPRILFVGQGTQRKGLHHLLKVWREDLYQDAELTLVVNQLDPGIDEMIDALPAAPKVLEGLSRQDLANEFERADVFVLPSLVEGFGLVYLEALAAGCHVIGTHNTGLPDLAAPEEVATLIPAGDLDSLKSALEAAIGKAVSGGYDRGAIRAFAATRTWENFRQGIRDFVESSEREGVFETPQSPATIIGHN